MTFPSRHKLCIV